MKTQKTTFHRYAQSDERLLFETEVLSDEKSILDVNGKIDLLVWNIYKQKRAASLSFLDEFLIKPTLVLLQESQNTPELKQLIKEHKKVADHVPAYGFNGQESGVMTLSDVIPLQSRAFQQSEPLIRIPKSALITRYLLSNQQELLVINIHAINFSFGVKMYSHQVMTLINQILYHEGPIILAGDFNAWSRKRLKLIYQMIRRINLKQVYFKRDVRKKFMGKSLDFVFYRGLSVQTAKIIETASSDHNPMYVEFSLY